ncbi:hypothetical protein CIT26_19450 [Mesorhizobium temperatum]|uniref:Uncharacterized protein n=1 Tax=Mesorhizobium temperatum TaxID=241416 RepID=A0A271LLR1_9HYPH|nr:hypothetical protein CIT26_19450 [Mesorhizobium temperatum]
MQGRFWSTAARLSAVVSEVRDSEICLGPGDQLSIAGGADAQASKPSHHFADMRQRAIGALSIDKLRAV